jgi:hypothetical protein
MCPFHLLKVLQLRFKYLATNHNLSDPASAVALYSSRRLCATRLRPVLNFGGHTTIFYRSRFDYCLDGDELEYYRHLILRTIY